MNFDPHELLSVLSSINADRTHHSPLAPYGKPVHISTSIRF